MRTGLAPQLTLEGAILRGGGFDGLQARRRSPNIAYVTLRGGEPAGDAKRNRLQGRHARHAGRPRAGATEGAGGEIRGRETPYRSLVHPMWSNHYGDYDHLARVKEWSLTGGGEEGGE